jgi:Mlc titration factor MtfA (ptsG expression regulator)
MSPGEVLLASGIPVVILLIGIAVIYLQRYEISVTRCFQYFKLLSPTELQTLQGFKYYHSLLPQHQVKFEKRVRHFLVNKTFVAEDSNEVTEEMKIMIAAACVQLTFGHRPFYLSHFKNISVYQWQPISLEEIKKKKVLLISWSEFQEGYLSPTDGYNPGMKVLAMALLLEERLRENSDKLFGDYAYRNWQAKSRALGERFIQTGLTPFRNYSEVDKADFFAVSVVYFFENPIDFHQRFPDLFKAMKKLLGQDPLLFKYKS